MYGGSVVSHNAVLREVACGWQKDSHSYKYHGPYLLMFSWYEAISRLVSNRLINFTDLLFFCSF